MICILHNHLRSIHYCLAPFYYLPSCPIIGHFDVVFILTYVSSYYKTKKAEINMKRLTTTPEQKCNMIGTKLKQYRLEQNLSQQALSNRLETEAIYICRGSISRIEDGSRTVTDMELYGLSKILNKPIESFFDDELFP